MRQIRPYMDELIELFDLGDKTKTPARMLSRDMQQKLALARAMAKQTEVLLLDEPTLGLDVETSHELRQILKDMAGRGERTVLLSNHDMNVGQDIYDRVIVINQAAPSSTTTWPIAWNWSAPKRTSFRSAAI